MPIIRTISELKNFIGGAGNVSLNIADIQPFLDLVGQQHLRPWLGNTTYAALEAETIVAPYAALLSFVQRPLAFLAMLEYVKVNAIMISGAGNFRIESDEKKTAYKYQENQYRAVMQEQGWESIERMLRYLDENSTTFTAWAADEARKNHRGLFINYAEDFRNLYGKTISRYIFETLRPVIEEVEDTALLPYFGTPFFDALKTDIQDNTLAGKRKELVRLAQKVIVHFSIREGIKRNWVKFEGDRVVQTETLEPQGYQKDAPAGKDETATLLRHSEDWGNRHVATVLSFLEANIEEPTFLLYKTYNEEQRDLKTLSKLLKRKVLASELATLRPEYLDAFGEVLPDKRPQKLCGCRENCHCSTQKNTGTFIL